MRENWYEYKCWGKAIVVTIKLRIKGGEYVAVCENAEEFDKVSRTYKGSFLTAIVCGAVVLVLLAAVASVIVSYWHWQPAMMLPVPTAKVQPAAVRVKGIGWKVLPADHVVTADVSVAVSIIRGDDPATADRYEARNDALRSIARRRDLARNDVALLMAYVGATNDVLRAERTAALKNDVLNLLRNQNPVPDGLAELLIGMLSADEDEVPYPPAVLDYCIQHLGALQGDIKEKALRGRVRAVLVRAARRVSFPYAGTALYSLSEDRRGTAAHDAELKRLTLVLCAPSANAAARIAAIQLAGQRGWREVLPILRATLAGARRDAVVDMAAIGSIGLLGREEDLPLLESMRVKGGLRLRPTVDAAVRRIKERGGGK